MGIDAPRITTLSQSQSPRFNRNVTINIILPVQYHPLYGGQSRISFEKKRKPKMLLKLSRHSGEASFFGLKTVIPHLCIMHDISFVIISRMSYEMRKICNQDGLRLIT